MRHYKNDLRVWPLPFETYARLKCSEKAAGIVYSKLGPGLKEKAYEKCLALELAKKGFGVQRQVSLPITYDGEKIGETYRIDLLVDDDLIIEVKAVDKIVPLHYLQLRTYLKISNKRIGLLINFNCEKICDGIKWVKRN